MKKTIKFLWWSIIFLIAYAIVFGMDFLEYFVPKNIFNILHINTLKDFALYVPFLIFFIMFLMLILFVITAINNRRKMVENGIPIISSKEGLGTRNTMILVVCLAIFGIFIYAYIFQYNKFFL